MPESAPSPLAPASEEHGAILVHLGGVLDVFVRGFELGRVSGGHVGVSTGGSPETVRVADLVFVPRERASSEPRSGFLDVAPELVVEVLSPSDRWKDVREKVAEYFQIGVSRVWVIDPFERSVLVYRSSSEVTKVEGDGLLLGEGTLEGFELALAELFRPD